MDSVASAHYGRSLTRTMPRTAVAYAYLIALTFLVVAISLPFASYDGRNPDRLLDVIYVCIAAAALNVPQVRIDQGRLSLSGIAIGTAAIMFNPLDAALVGIVSTTALVRRQPYPIIGNAIFSAAVAVVGSAIGVELHSGPTKPLAVRLVVLMACIFLNVATVATAFRIRSNDSIRTLFRVNFTRPFQIALAYMALAAILISYVLDGSPTGYLLATIVCILALALTDTIAGRRVRRVLESELSDADRHLFHSRAVEGVVHNLRNHVATAVGYLKEIDPRRLDPVDREAIETATAAANDAVAVLRSLEQGATPRVNFAADPVELNELVTRGLGMARPRARTKEIQMAVRESAEDVRVRADPLLMREVITNLVNNAIDAAPPGGAVQLSTGRRPNGWPYFSVADNGPGVSEDQRHHLFEPHFTTKEGGTGLGLFMSYGIVREHQGQLIYEGNRRGAVFTVILPPFDR